jgi:hypothetical protein
MEVDSVITPKLWPTKPKIDFKIGILFSVANNSDKTKGVVTISASTHVKVMAIFSETIY